jgi:hypothetical protein
LEKSTFAIVIGFAALAIGAVTFFVLSQPNEIANPILVGTDRSYYESWNPATILVTVNIKTEVYREGELVELQIVDGNKTQYAFYTTSQVQPGANVTYPLKLDGIDVAAGEYWVYGSYRGFESQTSFQYEGFKPSTRVECQQSSLCTYNVQIGDDIHPVNFRMNGIIEDMVANIDVSYLSIELVAHSAGSLQIAIPREVNNADSEFVVFVNEVSVDINEIPVLAREWTKVMGISDDPEKYRILIIPIQSGTNQVEIIGDYAI